MIYSSSRFNLVFVLALTYGLLAQTMVVADWTASGRFNYTDRTYDLTGFTGSTVLAVREADVEVYDINTTVVLGSGATDSSGDFSIVITDASTRDVGVRVLASTDQTATLHFSVVDDSNADAVYSYHDPIADETSHTSAADHAFGIMTMPLATGIVASTDWSSQVFNTFDMSVLLADWIENADGSRPPVTYSVGWNPTNGRTGSFYSGGSNRFSLSRDDAYDDPNILHELGHYIEDEFGWSTNTGGSHSIGDDDQDSRLSWSEGFATFVSNATLDFGSRPRPDIYSDRNSFDDPAHSNGFAYSLESQVFGGASNEQAVNAALYDLIDSSTSSDASPGVDDDATSGHDASVWSVVEEMRATTPAATTAEEFWDLWNSLALGSVSTVQTVLAGHQIDFQSDASEPNDIPGSATALTVGTSYTEGTFYDTAALKAGDEDWYSFSATSGNYYLVEVNGAGNSIYGRPDPQMFLVDTGLDTVLAYNDDPRDTSLNTQSSSSAQDMDESVPSILWKAPATATYYVMLRHASLDFNDDGRYGTYNVRVQSVSAPAPTVSLVSAQHMLQEQAYQILILGSNFSTGATVTTSDGGIVVSDLRWVAPECIVATLTPGSGVTNGAYSLTVTNPNASGDTLASAINVSSSAQPPLAITEVELGDDAVEVRNLGTVTATLTDWQLIGTRPGTADGAYTFPTFTLAAGATVVVSEDPGTNTASNLFDQDVSLNWAWFNGTTGDISLLDDSSRNVDYIRFVSGPATTHASPVGTGGSWMQREIASPAIGFTLSRSVSTANYRTTEGLSAANPTMPAGSSGRDNAVDAYEDNDEPRRAYLFDSNTSLTELAISARPLGTDVDWFGFLVRDDATQTISLTFTHSSGDLDMEVYPPGEESTPIFSATSSTDNESITLVPATTSIYGSGMYRVKVFGWSGATNTYSMAICCGSIVWVDFDHTDTESGTFLLPFNTLAEGAAAVDGVESGGTIKIKGDSGDSDSSEIITLDQDVTLEAISGTIRIGVSPAPPRPSESAPASERPTSDKSGFETRSKT